MDFKSILEQIQVEAENNQILEFATMPAKLHKFGVDVKLHIMQPEKQLQHGPRVKIFKPGTNYNFSITLEKEPRVIGEYRTILSTSDLNKLLKKVKHYRNAFIEFWNDKDMDILELTDLFRQIDLGFSIGDNK